MVKIETEFDMLVSSKFFSRLLLAGSFLFFSCSGKNEGFAPSTFVPPAPSAVVISPASYTLAVNNIKTFSATGGSGSYSYSIFSGSGSILSTTGNYTAPGVAGFATVRVTDALGQYADAVVTINAALQISPSNKSLGLNETQAFTATGGVSPLTYSVATGTGSVDATTGVYTAPAAPGSATVRVTDALGNFSDTSVAIYGALGISPISYTLAVNNTNTFSAAGGVGPYTFSILSGTGTINSSSGVYTAPVSFGTAIVRVTDSLGATADATVTINNALTISPTTQTTLINSSITFSQAGGVSPFTFSIISGTGSIDANTGIFTAPAANGSAGVRVTDAVGNTANATVTVTTALVLSPASVTLAVNNTTTFTGVGGTPPFTYAVASGTGSINASTGVYTAPAASGSATIRVTDSLGATDVSSVTINPALAISPASQTTLINSTISFSQSGGVSPYTYSFISGTGSIDINTGVYTAPAANGTDVVRVTDSLGNFSNATITVTTTLVLSPQNVTIAVNNSTTLVASGGTTPYTYSIASGGGSINAATGVYTAPATSGTATIRVTDSLGATDTSIVTINPALAISPTSQTTLINSTITFSASGGVTPYTFSVFSGTGTINASTGSYLAPASNGSAVVRVTDSLGNVSSASITITTTLSLSPSTKTLAVNNSTTFTAVGGTGPFTYSVFSGTGTIVAGTGVYTAPASSGSAVVRVTDSLGAVANSTVTINPALVISPSSQTMTINGTLNFSASNGVLPYTYSVFSGTGTIVAGTGVYTAPSSAGSAVVRVTDSLGNISSSTITITLGLGISPASTTLAVNNSTTFTALGGSSPYTFSVFSGGGSVVAATGVYTAPATSGTATVRVTDNLGATANATVTINAALAISPASKTLAVNNVFTFSASGGVSPYTYSIPSGGGSIVSSTGVYTAPSSAGSATVRVTDSLGNVSNSTVTINAALSISPTTQTVLISSVNTFTGSGGVSPYTYSIPSGGGSINSSTGAYTAPASNGSATIQVTDSLGNTATAAVTITTTLGISPSSVTLAVNNTRTFAATGGTSPFTFSILSGGGTINSSSGLYTAPATSGSATVRVTDSLGATANATVTINAALAISPSSQIVLISSTNTFTGSAGVSPYTYSIASGGGSINSSTGAYTAPASNGSATIQVMDSLGNTASSAVTITTTLGITPSSVTLAVTNTQSFSATGGTGPFTFSVFSGGGSIVSSTGVYTAGATSGSATVRVTDSLGATANATVTVNAALAISPSTATIASTGTQSFTASGGVSAYAYSIVSGPGSINSSTGLYTGVSAGSVSVRVTDSLGNTSDAALTVNGPLTVSPVSAYVVVNSDLAITPAGGVSPYTFAIVSGLGTIDPATGVFTAAATTGSVTIRTTDSVAATADTTVTVYNALTLSPLSLTISASGTQTFTASGGVGARTFSIYTGTGTINSSTGLYTAGVVAGTDTVHVADTIGNIVEATVTVVSQLSITPSTLKLPVFSTITFTSVLGTSPYTYSVFAGTGTINSSTGLYTAPSTAGTGTARVTDSISNTSNAAVTHIEPVQIANGSYHSCVRYNDGSVKCWGLGSTGQLGNGSTANLGTTSADFGGKLPFVNLGTGRTATSISAGIAHSCALLDNATVKCWGQNTYGQLGTGNTTSYGSAANQMGDSLPAVNVGVGRTVSKLFAFGYVTCVILDNNVSKCFGRNSTGQLGQGDITNRGTTSAQMGDSLLAINLGSGLYATKLSGGLDFTCALLNNATVKCFGASRYGQLGYENTNTLGDGAGEMAALAAVNLGTGRTAVDIGMGYSHSCAILDNGTAKCWGRNNKGQLGINSTSNTRGDVLNDMGDNLIAIPFTSFTPTSIYANNQMTCAMNASGGVRCWGLNTSGQLLVGSTATIGRSNNDIQGLTNVNFGTSVVGSSMSLGFYTGCAIMTNKRIKCWGSGLNAALLNGNTANNLGDIAGELGDSLPYVNH